MDDLENQPLRDVFLGDSADAPPGGLSSSSSSLRSIRLDAFGSANPPGAKNVAAGKVRFATATAEAQASANAAGQGGAAAPGLERGAVRRQSSAPFINVPLGPGGSAPGNQAADARGGGAGGASAPQPLQSTSNPLNPARSAAAPPAAAAKPRAERPKVTMTPGRTTIRQPMGRGQPIPMARSNSRPRRSGKRCVPPGPGP